MALYESNFIKLAKLIGPPEDLDGDAVSVARRDFPLYLTLCECSKYTRELRLTYLFDGPGGKVADPDLALRLYLDAHLVEVSSWAAHHHHNALLQLRQHYGRELDRRWSRNMMLSKWLDFLQDAGHIFLPASETTPAVLADSA